MPLAQFIFFVLSDLLPIYSGLVKKILILNNLGGFYGVLNMAFHSPLTRS